MRIIHEQGQYRIVEHADSCVELDDLKGDCFNPKANPSLDPEKLKEEEQHFEDLVAREGVFGYALEKWDPAVGAGWTHVDSCWGFVGQYSESDEYFKHYIVDELKSQIKEG